jgi:hypothetical protein
MSEGDGIGERLPLPAVLGPSTGATSPQHPEDDGERDGVRGSTGLRPIKAPFEICGMLRNPLMRAFPVGLPLTLTLSPQAGRGDPGGASMLPSDLHIGVPGPHLPASLP